MNSARLLAQDRARDRQRALQDIDLNARRAARYGGQCPVMHYEDQGLYRQWWESYDREKRRLEE